MNRQHWFILPDVLPFALGGLILAVILYSTLGIHAAIFPALLVLFFLWFFRNPQRVSKALSEELVSPADGIVLTVEEVEEDRFLKGKAIKVSIFLNVFNVHVNRSPISGKVEYTHYQPGNFLPAFKGHASHLNERNYVGIRNKENPKIAILVVQITGFIARRIVSWVKVGDDLDQGQRFGLIKFGSCTEVYLPLGSDILVSKGEKVKGGETIIGRLQNE